MSAVALEEALAPGRTPFLLELPAGTWISPSRVARLKVEAIGGTVVVNDGLGSSTTLAPGEDPIEFAHVNVGFLSGAVIVDASGPGTARITWVG